MPPVLQLYQGAVLSCLHWGTWRGVPLFLPCHSWDTLLVPCLVLCSKTLEVLCHRILFAVWISTFRSHMVSWPGLCPTYPSSSLQIVHHLHSSIKHSFVFSSNFESDSFAEVTCGCLFPYRYCHILPWQELFHFALKHANDASGYSFLNINVVDRIHLLLKCHLMLQEALVHVTIYMSLCIFNHSSNFILYDPDVFQGVNTA